MPTSRRLRTVIGAGLTIALLSLALGAGPAGAAADRKAPTTPKNLRVTGVTPYSVSLAWEASTDNSGQVSYHICCANTNSQIVPGPATSAAYTAGVEPGRSVTLVIYAFDPSGNYSKASNSVTVTPPRDTSPPSTPTVTVTDVGSTHISLAWSAVDDGPNVWYLVRRDGALILTTKNPGATFAPLAYETTYTFTVQARDFGGNLSAVSAPVSATTQPRDPTDTTPPSPPANLRTNGIEAADGETWLFWDASSDDRTPTSLIQYQVFINGVLDTWGVGMTWTIVYGTPMSLNTYSVVAIDESGNVSAPTSIVINNS